MKTGFCELSHKVTQLNLVEMRKPYSLKSTYQIFLLVMISYILSSCGAISALRQSRPSCIPEVLSTTGVSGVSSISWQTFDHDNGIPSDNATSIGADPSGGVWIGTARGIAYYDGATWTTYMEQDGLLSNLVLAIAVELNGTVWFGSDIGVTRFDGNIWTHFTENDGLPLGYIQVVTLDQAGRVWFGIVGAGSDWAFGNGTARLDNHNSPNKADDTWKIYLPTRQRMAGDIVSSIVDMGQAGIWFGVTPEGTVRLNSGRGGVWRLSGPDTRELSEDRWELRRETDGLISDSISSFARTADGGLWLGSLEGLMYLTSEATSEFSFDNPVCYTHSSGLPSDRVLSLAVDEENRVWVGTDAGLAVIANGRISVVTKSDGLVDNHIRAIAIAADGAVWVATPSGISVGR